MGKKQPARQPRAQSPQAQGFDVAPTLSQTGSVQGDSHSADLLLDSGLVGGGSREGRGVAQHGLVLEPYQVLLRPLVTEKGVHKSEKLNQYAFEVHPQANKSDIRSAVEVMFDVRVTSVRTQNRNGKPRRTKSGFTRTKPQKRAIVTLHEDSRINLF